MRLGRDDALDGVKSVLSGLSWPLAAVMPVTLCGPAPCLVKRDGQNPVRSLTRLARQVSAAFETGNVRKGSFASVLSDHGDFRSTPVNGHSQDKRPCLKGAKGGSDPDSRRRETAIVRHIENGSVKPLPCLRGSGRRAGPSPFWLWGTSTSSCAIGDGQ